jgi:hypothetical protein
MVFHWLLFAEIAVDHGQQQDSAFNAELVAPEPLISACLAAWVLLLLLLVVAGQQRGLVVVP